MRKLTLFAPVSSGIFIAAPFIVPSLFPVTWVSLLPLFWSLREGTSRQGFVYGWVTGIVTNLVGFYWLNYTISVFGGFPYAVSALIFAGFGVYAGIPFAIFSFLVRRYGFGPMNLFPPLFWVAIEFSFPLLFPWHLANSQSLFLTFIQSADLVGPYGASFLLVWANSVVFNLITSPSTEKMRILRTVSILIVIIFACLIYGHRRLHSVTEEMRAARTLDVAAVQGSVNIHKKWDVSFLESNLQSYLDLSRKTDGATLALWPESAVENWISESFTQLPKTHVPEFPQTTKYLMFGARSFRGDPASPSVMAFNSAFLVNSQGRVLGHYHKQVLLAFGEYIPFLRFLSGLPGMPPVGQAFSTGTEPLILELPGSVRIGTLICYEDLMPFLASAFVREKKANLLINLTNDAWFGKTVAPWQHARLAQWRAIENRRTLVRATNTGLTTIINAKGELLENLPLFSTGVLKAKAEILEAETFYVRFGDWFAWLALLASFLIWLYGWRAGSRLRF